MLSECMKFTNERILFHHLFVLVLSDEYRSHKVLVRIAHWRVQDWSRMEDGCFMDWKVGQITKISFLLWSSWFIESSVFRQFNCCKVQEIETSFQLGISIFHWRHTEAFASDSWFQYWCRFSSSCLIRELHNKRALLSSLISNGLSAVSPTR